MRQIFLLLLAGVIFLLNSCSSDTQVSPLDKQQGGISLNIDRLHKPENVVSVTAYMTRENFDTLSGSLNLVSDTTADITFNDVAAGSWHLRVDAADEENVVVYTGETDANILAGITTQVYLTLEPTGAGVGNIYIFVNWGVPQNTSWQDYPYNPIISPSIVPETPLGTSRPKVYLEEGIYKMWFTSIYNSASMNTWYAVSVDGMNWQLGSNYPVLTKGSPGSWDDYSAISGPVIKVGNQYKMYYLGFRNEYDYWHIGLATSTNGINWTKNPYPVVYASANEVQIMPSEVLLINDTFYLYYSVRQRPYYDIRLATSTDGINFTKYSGNPILVAGNGWEGTGVYSPSIIYEDNQYKMIYANVNEPGGAFGMAYSDDGINWTKDPDNPFFSNADINSNWCYRITYPFWRKYNNHYRIYYAGNTYGYYVTKIGVIIK